MSLNVIDQDLLFPKEAASLLGVHVKTVRRHIANGDLRALRVGQTGRYRIRRRDLDDLLRPVEPTEAA